jgi:flagellum-specific ATP synthase
MLQDVQPIRAKGTVQQVIGLIIEGRGPGAPVGDLCDIYPRYSRLAITAEVVGFRDQRVLLMPLGDIRGIPPGSMIIHRGEKATIGVSHAMQGRILNGLGVSIDHQEALPKGQAYPLYGEPLNPLVKNRIRMPLDVGVRAINGLLTLW